MEWIVEAETREDLVDGHWYGGLELVRCKDCRWHEDEQPGMVYCPATVGGWVDDDWFCKGGERKDDDPEDRRS